MENVNFILPGFYEHYKIYQDILDIKEKKPYMFQDNINIGAIYGNFQFCIWDGGRIFTQYFQTSQEKICEIRDYFNEKNIPIRLIYTNPIVQPEHLNDRFCNLVTNLCHNGFNEIVINNPILEQYLREKYPNFKYISSTTKCLSKPEDALKEIENSSYYMVCLDYNLNSNFSFLEKIPDELRNKVEFLSNAICGPGCANRKNHYKLNGFSHLHAGRQYTLDFCELKDGIMSKTTCDSKNNILPEQIYGKYTKMGFQNFKLEGRTLSTTAIILSVARYLVKPEYQWEFLEIIYEQSGIVNNTFII